MLHFVVKFVGLHLKRGLLACKDAKTQHAGVLSDLEPMFSARPRRQMKSTQTAIIQGVCFLQNSFKMKATILSDGICR